MKRPDKAWYEVPQVAIAEPVHYPSSEEDSSGCIRASGRLIQGQVREPLSEEYASRQRTRPLDPLTLLFLRTGLPHRDLAWSLVSGLPCGFVDGCWAFVVLLSACMFQASVEDR